MGNANPVRDNNMSSDISLSLPSEFTILEDDLIYVATGYNKNDAVLVSRETSIQNLRKYIVKLEAVSGVSVIRNLDGKYVFYSNSQEGNLIDINYSSVYPYPQNISTTGLNVIAGTGIQYQVSNSWPYQYTISQLDLRAVANNSFTYGPITSTTSVLDSQLYKNIDWSKCNSKPIIENDSGYCYIVEFFIDNFTLSHEPIPSPQSKGRPSTIDGNVISWSCTEIVYPHSVIISMNGNSIEYTYPSNPSTYTTSNENIYLKYIEKRNLNSNSKIQPLYTISPASYTRACTGTYQYWVATPTTENPNAGYYASGSTSWGDNGILGTTLSMRPYRHLKLDFAELIT